VIFKTGRTKNGKPESAESAESCGFKHALFLLISAIIRAIPGG
jgi:hypothetical protein